jgi:ubiquinone/menaquinone biosynthesis C-methylase UbiE
MRVDFIQAMHASTARDYIARVVENDKAKNAEVAGRFAQEYWDGDRRYGYGGYRYDGRWAPFARKLADRYGLRAGARVLDVGCGKAFLLYELQQAVPGLEVAGLDISAYALAHAKEEIRPYLTLGDASRLPYSDGSFDLVISLATLHNLPLPELWSAIAEIERVGTGEAKYLMVESYRNEREKVNLLYWQLTCKSFYSVTDWEWLYGRIGYHGDYDFIFFQ